MRIRLKGFPSISAPACCCAFAAAVVGLLVWTGPADTQPPAAPSSSTARVVHADPLPPAPTPTPGPTPAPTPTPPAPAPTPTPVPDVFQPVIVVPAETKEYYPVVVKLNGATTKAAVKWSLTPKPAYQRQANKLTFEFFGPPGDYIVAATVFRVLPGEEIDFAEAAPVTATIVGSKPPTPPNPPNPPAPSDPLTASLQAAYTSETDAAKSDRLKYLAAIYTGASGKITDGQTVADLFTQVSTAIHDPSLGFPKGGMPNVLKAIGAYLNTTVGGSGTVDKAKTTAAFNAVASALKAVK